MTGAAVGRDRPLRGRRGLYALVAVVACLATLSGCVWFANADREVSQLREFALTLDGVTAVDEVSSGPTNVANPFGSEATAVALITIEGDDWPQTLPTAAHAVIDWLATKQTNKNVLLGAGIQFPGGVVGLADIAVTDVRLDTVAAMVDDERFTHVAVGWDPDAPGNNTSNADAVVAVERMPDAVVSSIVNDWMPRLSEFSALQVATPSDSAGERSLLLASAPSPDYLSWIDLVDARSDVLAWRADGDGATVTIDPNASLTDVETALRAHPGFAQVGELTLVKGELTIVSDGSASPARALAEKLASDARFSSIALGDGTLDVVADDLAAALAVLDLADDVFFSGDVLLKIETKDAERKVRLDEVTVDNAREWLPVFAAIPDSIDFDRVTVFSSGDLGIEFKGPYESAQVLPVVEAVHDAAIAQETQVSIQARDKRDLFLVSFEAVPQLDRADVSGGRGTPLDKNHDEVIEFWNSLG